MAQGNNKAKDGVIEATEELVRAEAEAAAAVELANQYAGGTDIVKREEGTPEIVKARMTEMRNEAMKRQRAVAVAQKRLKEEMERRMGEALEVMRPLEQMIDHLNTGLKTVSLYLGRNEEIVLLRDGESADAQEPITLRQMLLFMDEECAVAAEEGGILPVEIEVFDEWLLSDPAHLNQVLPETKGIVALRPRRHLSEHHDPATREAMREANQRTYWLIRNGERVYRTLTDLYVDERILPYSNEFERIFSRTVKGRVVALRPGSYEWERAQESAEKTERQYMRVGLILEGLLHRTPIFHPLPGQGISFLDPLCVRDGRVRYITDAEALLTTGKETFQEWRLRLSEELRVGMRIILGPGLERQKREGRYGNTRLSPATASLPKIGGIYTIEERNKGGEMVFRYREGELRWVGDSAWGGGEYREPKRRASCRVFSKDAYVLPFDLATVEEMEAFLSSRESRHSYVEMWPILKEAIAAKRREAEVEAPFRTMLIGVLARDNKVEVAEAEEAVDDLISWWKFKNKYHRPLLLEAARPEIEIQSEDELRTAGGRRRRSQGALFEEKQRDYSLERLEEERLRDVEQGAKAVRMIVAEHKRRLQDARRSADPKVLEQLKREHPSYLAIVRLRSGTYLVLEAAEPTKDVFVHESEYTARGKLKERREWTLPGTTRPKSWNVLAQHERFERWELHADEREHLRGSEADAFVEQVIAEAKADKKALALAWDGIKFTLWLQGSTSSFDNEHLLTQSVKAPQVGERERPWKRKGLRKPAELVKWGWESEKSLHSGLPWEEREWRSHFNEDEDDSPRALKHNVIWKDEKRLKALREDQETYEAASKRHGTMQSLSRALLKSVAEEWLRRAWAKERARFDEDFGDAELWPAHKKSKERHINFNLRRETESSSYGRRDHLEDALNWLVESGVDPSGWTVAQILKEATKRFGAQALARAKKRDDDDEPKPFTFKAPEETLDYVLTDERDQEEIAADADEDFDED